MSRKTGVFGVIILLVLVILISRMYSSHFHIAPSDWRIFTVMNLSNIGQKSLPETSAYSEIRDLHPVSLEDCLSKTVSHMEQQFKNRSCPDCYSETGYYCAKGCSWKGDSESASFGDGGFLSDFVCKEVHPGLIPSYVKNHVEKKF